jgi:hypothetical protein
MRVTEEQKQIVAALGSVYESIQFHGVYAKYTRSISILSQILKLDDPSELHYVMMHLSRLCYLKNQTGAYLWGSSRYAELLGCDSLTELMMADPSEFLDIFAKADLQTMEVDALHYQQISTTLIDTPLNGKRSLHVPCESLPLLW